MNRSAVTWKKASSFLAWVLLMARLPWKTSEVMSLWRRVSGGVLGCGCGVRDRAAVRRQKARPLKRAATAGRLQLGRHRRSDTAILILYVIIWYQCGYDAAAADRGVGPDFLCYV